METVYVVDTHALVWHLQGDAKLGAAAKTVLNDPASILVLPIIALAEACWIIEAGRTSIPSVEELLKVVDADTRVTITPLDRAKGTKLCRSRSSPKCTTAKSSPLRSCWNDKEKPLPS